MGKDNTNSEYMEDPKITFNFKRLRESTSSEEQNENSDENMEQLCVNNDENNITGDDRRHATRGGNSNWTDDRWTQPQPSHAQEMVKEAEAAIAQMFQTPGNVPPTAEGLVNNMVDQFLNEARNQQVALHHSAIVDENYLVIGAHLDKTLIDKIVNHEYVDFTRLIPKDKLVLREEDHRMEIVNKGGFNYFVPVADRKCSSITNFHRWEQAFRIYSNVFTKRYPHKASELIQYNHIIYTASLSYVWDNVYQYDKEFRLHLSHYLQRSWAVILQQVWSMCLRDRLKFEYSNNNKHSPNARKKTCRWFNKGKCTAGKSCRYDHRCDECGKWGHGAHICRRKLNKSNDNGSNGNASHNGTVATSNGSSNSK